ncbi:MAG: hypothetical protein H6737_19650 [Alphaproteobacteria bacterium]|nr:hypothetical protein [Alphaproteobacteria bacterium]
MIRSILVTFAIAGCGPRMANVVEAGAREETRSILERFRAYRLAPAGVAPPSLEHRNGLDRTDGISGSIELVLAEDAEWNQWSDGSARLFNNRTAHLFQVEITSEEPVRWLPERTRLELNVEGNVFRAAESQEVLLEDLLFWAYHQERNVLDGDLALRARGAGPLREAYMPSHVDTLLTGLIAFPLVETPENERFYTSVDPSEYHVVSMRVTVGLETPHGRESLVWLLE